MAGEYRRQKGSQTWHWCRNCASWPSKPGSFDTRSEPPADEDKCTECDAKTGAEKCQE
jgi:hypothetical protein